MRPELFFFFTPLRDLSNTALHVQSRELGKNAQQVNRTQKVD